MFRSFPSHIVLAVLLVGCSDDDSSDPKGDVGDTLGLTDTSDTIDPALRVDASIDEGGVQTCADSSLRNEAHFDRGVSPTPPNSDLWIWAGGEMAGDFDGDGWLDVMTPNELGVELFKGSPSGFTSLGPTVLGAFELSFGTGGSVADYDGDGDLDVYVTRFVGDPGPDLPGMGKNRLLQNNGDGSFTDVTDVAGVDGCGFDPNTGTDGCYRTMSSSWGDMDGDGDLDLFVGNYGWVDESGAHQDDFYPAEPSILYRNDGDGTFTDVSERLPQKFRDGYTYAGGFFDLDDDGHLDLYVVNDFGNNWPNHVLLGVGDGTFVDEQPTNESFLNVSTTGMGLGVGDFNLDGKMDVAVPAWNTNLLLLSGRDGAWSDFSLNTDFTVDGRRDQKVGWGTLAADMNNDGLLDLVQQYGFVANENDRWSNPRAQPDALYLNVGTAEQPFFEDVGLEWGIADPGVNRGVVIADFDRDGYLDIAKRNLDGPNVVYNSRCGEAQWLRVELEQPGTMNVDGIGAKLTVDAGEHHLTRWMYAGGGGYGAGNPPEVHFGLGDVDRIDTITVRWPDGKVSVVSDVAASQAVTITRGD